jgi:hypothetical protein
LAGDLQHQIHIAKSNAALKKQIKEEVYEKRTCKKLQITIEFVG